MRIAVLGAGISGLSAAYHLRKHVAAGSLPAGTVVEVYDRRERVGGVLETLHRDGFQIEQSADNFITTVPWGLDLCKELGLGDSLVQTNPRFRRTYVTHRGRLALLPDGFLMMAPTKLWPMAVTPLLSPLGKLRAAMEPLIRARRDDNDENMAHFVRRRLGREVFERLVEPLVSGVYAADMEKLSVLATLPRFRAMEREHGSLILAMRKQLRENRKLHLEQQSGARYSMFVTLREGLSSLCDVLAAQLPADTFLLGHDVTALDRIILYDRESRERAVWWISDSTGEHRRYDAVVCALPAYEAARLLAVSNAHLGSLLGTIEHQGTAIATFAFDAKRMKQAVTGMGFVVPKIEQSPILAGSFSSLKYEHRAPEGKLLIRIFAGGARAPEMAELPEPLLVPLLREEMNRILHIDGEPLFCEVAHWPRTMPQYHVGHRELVRTIEGEAVGEPSFALAGNYLHGVGIPNCIRSGQLAADKLTALNSAYLP